MNKSEISKAIEALTKAIEANIYGKDTENFPLVDNSIEVCIKANEKILELIKLL
jgi:hypothetical protein